MFSFFQSLDEQLAQAERELGRAELKCDNARAKMDQAKQEWQAAKNILVNKQDHIDEIRAQIRAEEARRLNGGDGFFGSIANLLFGDYDQPAPPKAPAPVRKPAPAHQESWLDQAVHEANKVEKQALAKEQADAELARSLAQSNGGLDAQKQALKEIEKAHQLKQDEALAKALAQQDEGGMLAQQAMLKEIEKENQIKKDEELARALAEEEFAYAYEPSAPAW